jgi:hypothetical protein
MRTGRWFVVEHLTEWFEEFRVLHRKDGLIVKERDDLMSASRYLEMMLGFARKPGRRGWSGPIVYSSKGIV